MQGKVITHSGHVALFPLHQLSARPAKRIRIFSYAWQVSEETIAEIRSLSIKENRANL